MSARPELCADTSVLRIDTHSDWHVGAGYGEPGGIDALVLRGPDGLPFIPGSTITGVWRDAAWTVARALDADPSAHPRADSGLPADGAEAGRWQQWHSVIFGGDPLQPRAA